MRHWASLRPTKYCWGWVSLADSHDLPYDTGFFKKKIEKGLHYFVGTAHLFFMVIKIGCHTFANPLPMTRPICKFHTIVFSSIINPYFMLWVIFPIPDPAMSFKKIHVLIRLAHRHSFNEQINHSDGYSGVITGFKYDNLHPNGAARPLTLSKKGRQNWYDPFPALLT